MAAGAASSPRSQGSSGGASSKPSGKRTRVLNPKTSRSHLRAERAASTAGADAIQARRCSTVKTSEHYESDILFFFDGKPNEETRSLLKSHGFRWAPSVGAWQRQLTDNGKAAARQVMKALQD